MILLGQPIRRNSEELAVLFRSGLYLLEFIINWGKRQGMKEKRGRKKGGVALEGGRRGLSPPVKMMIHLAVIRQILQPNLWQMR